MKKELRCITINTDASFNSQYNTSGYAFYIVSDIFKIQKSGLFKMNPPKNSGEAEMMAIGNLITIS